MTLSRLAIRAAWFDFGIARIQFTVGDVVPDGSREEEDILLHDADLVAQGTQRQILDVDAVDSDRPFRGFVKAGKEVAQGRFPGAAWTDESDCFASADLQIDPVQYFFGTVIAERHFFVDDIAVQMRHFDGSGLSRISGVRSNSSVKRLKPAMPFG
jgi:hypothetical protein